MTKKHTNRDPYWTTAKFNSTCACGKAVKQGDRIFYYPSQKKAVCETCGEEGASALRAEIAYERYGSDCAMDY